MNRHHAAASRPTRRPLRPADLHRLRSIGEVAVHPAGRTAVVTVTWPDGDLDVNRSHLWSLDVDGSDPRARTEGPTDTLPRFSPDGSRLAFVRSAPEIPAAVVVMDWPVGDVRTLASFPDGQPAAIEWIDADRLVVLAPQRPPHQRQLDEDELARRPRILTSIDYRFNGRGAIHDRPQQVLTLTVPGGMGAAGNGDGSTVEPVAIGAAGVDHVALAVAPGGDHVAAVAATDPDGDLTGANHVWRYPVDGAGAPVRLTPPGGRWNELHWHRDGTLLVIGLTDVGWVGFDRLHRVALPPDGIEPDHRFEPTVTTVADDDGNLAPGAFRGGDLVGVEGGVLAPGIRRGRVAVDHHDLNGDGRSVVHEGDHQVVAIDATFDRQVVLAAVTGPTWPAELWRLGEGEPTRLLGLNDGLLAELDLSPVTRLSVPSTDGVEVEAFVTHPPASAPGATASGRPGLVYVHGGPMFQYGLGFFDEFQLAAAAGYVVIGGNPRGSDGYGEAWARAIVGDLGGRDHEDVLALADHLGELADVDPARIGIGGGSYGGFMTTWALAHDRPQQPRFRAGLIERAVTSWTTMYGTSDIGTWFTTRTLAATIDEQPEEVRRQSPLTYAAAIAAPTLIIHSEEDWRCPIEQAEQLFAAIRRAGGDVTFVRFPGENHELSRSGSPRHRVERFEIIHEFFADHLGGADFGTSHLDPGPERVDASTPDQARG